MAEWLGTALQKLLQRFKSASDLFSFEITNARNRIFVIFLFAVCIF